MTTFSDFGGRCQEATGGLDILRALAYVNDGCRRGRYRLKGFLDQSFDIPAVLFDASYQLGGRAIAESHVPGTKGCRPLHEMNKR